MRRSILPVLLVMSAVAPAPLLALPDEAEVRTILEERIDEDRRSVGIVVGMIDAEGSRVVGHGRLSHDDDRSPDARTIFEIGSVSKVFTAILLADMVERGEVSLEDPVGEFLPDTVRMPTRNGREITLLDLATHRSGLPSMPANFDPEDPSNPYADYTPELLYAFLSDYELTRDIGAVPEYSNLGAGLLGHALAQRAGTDYEKLMRKRIAAPLKMKDTVIRLSSKQRKRLATGHDVGLQPVANWDLPTLAGAGAIRSTAADMLTFLAANLGLRDTPLAKAMETTHRPRLGFGQDNLRIGLGWILIDDHDTEITFHNGQTGGYHAFVGFDKAERSGVVVLSNAAGNIDDIGMHLLERGFPLAEQDPPPTETRIAPETFDEFVGRYQIGPSFVLAVTREAERFYVQATGQQRLEVFPESETTFFMKAVEAKIRFVRDDDGRVDHLVLLQGGLEQKAKRLGEDGTAEFGSGRSVTLAVEILDRYVGRYELAPGFVITVTREGSQLEAQVSGQPAFEIFADSETEFYYKVVDARLTFNVGENGVVESLTLHQGGRDVPAKRLD